MKNIIEYWGNACKIVKMLEIIALFTQWVENEAFKTSKEVSPFSPE